MYNQDYNTEKPVLNRSYFNYCNQYSQSQWHQRMQYSQNPVEPITQNIFNTLSNIKEKPKNHQKNIFRETVPDVEDATLPKELTAMFQPLFCKLCSAQLSSNIMAKLHYKSKNHEKKIRKYLVEYSERTGEPLHKRARVSATTTTKTEEEQNPTWFHCDICDLPLTGKLHAESHYMGKNHQKAVRGHKAPAGKGYYNNEGKWIRLASVKSSSNMGQDTFGLDFKPKSLEQPVPEPPTTPDASTSTKFECSLCNIGTTCQEQLDMHYKGQKHQKKLKQLGMMTTLPQGSSNKTASAVESKPLDNINLSVHRTPSGDFYCQNCNLSLNSEPQFILHIKSKGHLKKIFHKQ
ncbi:zinc finger matrin-type protein 4 isoform X2 [Leptinotarsa decemlineata]